MLISAIDSTDRESVGLVFSKMCAHGYTLGSAELLKKVIPALSTESQKIACYKQVVAECSTPADEQVCQLVLDAMVSKKVLEEACEMVKDMVARGFKLGSLRPLFRELVNAGMCEEACSALEMVDSEEAHNDLIEAFCGRVGSLDKAGEMVKRALARGFTPQVRRLFEELLRAGGRDKDAYAVEMVGSSSAHCEFISALCTVGRCEEAYELVETKIESNEEHAEKCFNKLVHELKKISASQKVVRLLVKAFYLMQRAMITAPFKPDVESCSALAHALRRAGRLMEASYATKFCTLH